MCKAISDLEDLSRKWDFVKLSMKLGFGKLHLWHQRWEGKIVTFINSLKLAFGIWPHMKLGFEIWLHLKLGFWDSRTPSPYTPLYYVADTEIHILYRNRDIRGNPYPLMLWSRHPEAMNLPVTISRKQKSSVILDKLAQIAAWFLQCHEVFFFLIFWPTLNPLEKYIHTVRCCGESWRVVYLSFNF